MLFFLLPSKKNSSNPMAKIIYDGSGQSGLFQRVSNGNHARYALSKSDLRPMEAERFDRKPGRFSRCLWRVCVYDRRDIAEDWALPCRPFRKAIKALIEPQGF